MISIGFTKKFQTFYGQYDIIIRKELENLQIINRKFFLIISNCLVPSKLEFWHQKNCLFHFFSLNWKMEEICYQYVINVVPKIIKTLFNDEIAFLSCYMISEIKFLLSLG